MDFLRRAIDFVVRPTHSRTIGILIFFVLVATVSLTVYVAQQQQQVRQQAAGQYCNTYGTFCPSGQECNYTSCSDITFDCEGTCILKPTPTPTSPPPTPTLSPVVIPTATPTATPAQIAIVSTPTPTPRPLPTAIPIPTFTPAPGSVQLALTLAHQGLTGIPVNRNRSVTVVLQGADDQIVAKTGTVDYSNGTFNGTVNLGVLPSGSYKLKVKAGNFLRSLISNLVISGTAASAQTTLVAGLASDQNNDNIDAISFYANGLRTCFGSTLGIKKCDKPEDVDLNGDANVDAIDYQIYLKGIRALRQGLPVQ